MITSPKAIMFDWDGTLVDSLQAIFMSHNHVRVHMGLPEWTMEELLSNMQYSTRELYPRIYGARKDEAIKELVRFSGENSPKYVKPFDGTKDALEAGKAAGIPMGVVSNMRHDALLRQADALALSHYFKVIAGAGYADRDKPDPAPLIKALDSMGLKPGKDILYVGDTVTDLLCANAAGCSVAFLDQGRNQQDLIARHKPDFVVSNITEFKKLIFSP